MSQTINFQKALETLRIEQQVIEGCKHKLMNCFDRACDVILQCKGRVVVTGMGKSGHIGRKMAATFASTGTPSFFMHPGEAGMAIWVCWCVVMFWLQFQTRARVMKL